MEAASLLPRRAPESSGPESGSIHASQQPVLDRRARVLLGWLDDLHAARILNAVQAGEPLSNDQQLKVGAARAAVRARPSGAPQGDLVRPIGSTLDEYLELLRQSPLAQPYFVEGWEVALVDLPRVYGVQPHVFIDHADDRVRDIDLDDVVSVAQVTLPMAASTEFTQQFDMQQKAFIISSANPNLRVVGAGAVAAQDGLPGAVMLGFQVALMASYVQVAEVQGRFFLRDGYHRALGLIRRGLRYAPVLVRRGLPLAALIPVPAAMLAYERYMGDHPPFLADYLNESVAIEARVTAAHKVVVVQAIELGG